MDQTSPEVRSYSPPPSPLERLSRLTKSLAAKFGIHRSNRSIQVVTAPEITIVTKPTVVSEPTPVAPPPRETRKQRRARQKTEYAERRTAQQPAIQSQKRKLEYEPPHLTKVEKTETSPTTHYLDLTHDNMEWVRTQERLQLGLTNVDGIPIWYGDFIRGDTLLDAQKKVKETGKMPDLDKLLFQRLPPWLRKERVQNIGELLDPKADRHIYYAKHKNGGRVYFMRYDNFDGKYVIIRVAVCADVTSQNQILPTLCEVKDRK